MDLGPRRRPELGRRADVGGRCCATQLYIGRHGQATGRSLLLPFTMTGLVFFMLRSPWSDGHYPQGRRAPAASGGLVGFAGRRKCRDRLLYAVTGGETVAA